MDGGDHSSSLSDNDEDENELPDILSRVRLVDAPVLLFVCFHHALRSELSQLRRLAETASFDDRSQEPRGEVILKLQRRFRFLKLAFKYHCAAEDEVIFIALDRHVKNVVSTYSLEHKSTNDLYDSIIHLLDEPMPLHKNISKLFQELVYCIGILQTSIYQHMLKEEEQVFPLVIQKLPTEEQASLVWQFICSVPIILLEELLPWMVSFLSEEKQAEVTQCINEIAPMEKTLQEVLVSWIGSNQQSFTEVSFKDEVQGGAQSLDIARSFPLGSCNRNFKELSSQMEVNGPKDKDGTTQVNVLHLWHDAIIKDLEEILKELCLIKNCSCFQNLESLLIQLKFFADVLTFYSNAQKRLVLKKLAGDWLSKSTENFCDVSHIEDLQQLLFYRSESGMPLCEFVGNLCQKLESFVSRLRKQFAFQENEVFPVIRKNCSNGMQEGLLSLSLYMMPLGLVKGAITWFSVHLPEKESRSILYFKKKGNDVACKGFASLLQEWFRIGYSGKTSIEKFRQDLHHMFKSKYSFLPEQIKKAPGFSLNSDCLPHKVSSKMCLSYPSPSGSNKYDTPYSTGINLHILFPATVVKLHQKLGCHAANSSSVSFLEDPKPIDIIFFFHKAIKKDLDYLVLGSAQLEDNAELLMDFHKRFHIIYFLYQIHSDAEDEIVFPALEASGRLKNISHAYAFDHNVEVKHFNKISHILHKMSELDILVSTSLVRYQHLCRKLQQICKSMHKSLSGHIDREEAEIWPLSREFFSNKEQGKIIGCMLGRIGAQILQDMIPWLMASLTQKEQHVLMFLWSMATKNTMFNEWLSEWWDGYSITKPEEGTKHALKETVEPLEIISKYFSEEVLDELQEEPSSNTNTDFHQKDHIGDNVQLSNNKFDRTVKVQAAAQNKNEISKSTNRFHDNNKHGWNQEKEGITNPIKIEDQSFQFRHNSRHYDRLLKLSQDDLEKAIRRVTRDSSLDPQEKSYIIQNLLISRWIIRQKISFTEVDVKNDEQEFPGKHPSYRDPLKLIYGCKHYKRNCKIFCPCCNQLHTCIHCHNEVSDHIIDRKSITKMMCMECLNIQPINATCSTSSCKLTMAKYYCWICRLFEDEKEIYHCPYCNLCRVGKGLGTTYFHCMSCNACMSRSLLVHTCREKHLEDNCPICHEYIFTSLAPVKALPCGHVMHSACFQEYTGFNYTCPICSKSIVDMQDYFKKLDSLLAEEKMSDELSSRTQVILCNDCEKKGVAPFHWRYHKCPYCGSYNTRVL
ncbi:hypothetical protein HN51_003321 [Arachis hypogaea]|uniref:Uncharacterized protein n=1 Tax=Arachis hypogaea TaxID=3818 RepID=A0A445EJ87_ARAHY|nr:zinc finger protein BRUTUS-like At1g18910 [Arachis hypogaea]QHO51692.1 Putative RING finger protein [Arachis hypogaea]RYR75474.1 hypothetical protein Ahy_A01g000012 [Arachis hypogaea]